METQWRMDEEQRRIADFTDNLAGDIRKELTHKDETKVSTYALDKNSGFMIELNYNDKHYIEVMVSKNRGKKDELTIDRFWGVRPVGISLGGTFSSPDELRATAQVYDEMTGVLDKKFGKPVSEHHGRAIYEANLEEALALN